MQKTSSYHIVYYSANYKCCTVVLKYLQQLLFMVLVGFYTKFSSYSFPIYKKKIRTKHYKLLNQLPALTIKFTKASNKLTRLSFIIPVGVTKINWVGKVIKQY